MTMLIIPQKPTLVAAIEASKFLADWLKEPDLATIELFEPAFEELAGLVEALPPTVADAGMMCFLRNYLDSSRAGFGTGEWGAALHQLRQMQRKLTRALTDEGKPLNRHAPRRSTIRR